MPPISALNMCVLQVEWTTSLKFACSFRWQKRLQIRIQDDGKQNPLHMHAVVCSPFVSSCLHPDLAYITFSDMSYQVTEGTGYVKITLLVMGQVPVEFKLVVGITGGTTTGE